MLIWLVEEIKYWVEINRRSKWKSHTVIELIHTLVCVYVSACVRVCDERRLVVSISSFQKPPHNSPIMPSAGLRVGADDEWRMKRR